FDALRPWFPASTTKLMTAYVVFRAVLAGEITLQSPVRISATAAAAPASKMGFPPGSVLAVDDALKVMMVKSANDIAMAVAETVGGSEEAFAERMNREAQRLGMSRSHFVNPHGLPDPRQVTTARDMAVLARALLVEFPQHRDYFRIAAIQHGRSVMKNFNPLIERYPGANGMKTGFICASGYNLVASARRGEHELIAVVFGEYGGKARAEHAARLLNQGFEAAGPASEQPVTLASVASGQEYEVPLDMRPFVCSANRAPEASEANMQEGPDGAPKQPVSALGPPIYLGPPVQITVEVPAPPAKYGEPGFVARIPKPRPELASDGLRADVPAAFAPVDAASGDTGPAQAIGAAAGAARPLENIAPN
ncbi:MAG TPA: D-alanyl-D-alanine carboxypeptidase family protein, partial [Propylenella sp.]|nr:D-alanyl-D-alanine carboxypeptidase family protein [Propylenella sp.]